MSDATSLKQIADDELVARFVLRSRWIREDKTVRPEAFMPNKTRLSVTCHSGLSQTELWELGQAVADKRPAPLYGRADVQALVIRNQSLSFELTIEPKNHANIIGWPEEVSAQKSKAQEIASRAVFVEKPSKSEAD